MWTDKFGWKVGQDGLVSLASQEEIIKTRNKKINIVKTKNVGEKKTFFLNSENDLFSVSLKQ